MKLKIKRTIGYGTYSDKELKKYLKEQAIITAKQILQALDNAEVNSTAGTRLPSYERVIEDLRQTITPS